MNPAPLPELQRHPFAFTPAIEGVAHNEWLLRRSSWAEITVVNVKTSEELSVPRKFLAGVHEDEGPLAVAALTERLELRRGRVVPIRRGVITMPRARQANAPEWKRAGRGAGVVAIRVEPRPQSRVRRVLRGSVAIGFLACLALVFVVRDAHLGRAMGWTTGVARDLPLASGDDYFAVVNKLGRPASDRWIEARDGGVRRLWYPRRRLSVILMGETRDSAAYVRTLGRDGVIVHSANPTGIEELTTTPVWR